MSAQSQAIAPGFGARLREERKRLGLNQEQLAEVAGVKRLAQAQYESEAREPRLSYLSAISSAGANLYYLLYGKEANESSLSGEQQADVERRAFAYIEEYVDTQCGGHLHSDGRVVLFRILRSHLARALLKGEEGNFNLSDLALNGRVKNG